MFKHLIKPRSQNPHPFTDEQISPKAYELWRQRGPDSTSKENWEDAIRALRWEHRRKRVTKPIQRLWWKTGVGPHIQRVLKWTGIPEKRGWDFAQLLAVPVVLALVGWGLNEYAKERDHRQQQAEKEKEQLIADNKAKQDRQLADDRAKQDRQLADDRAKQDTLVKYLDQMAGSLKDGLLDAKPGSKEFVIAQSKTVLALQSLDRNRQHLVVQFLRASGLSDAPTGKWKTRFNNGILNDLPAKSRVLLYKAQMEKADLTNSDLSGAVLIGANLGAAKLGCTPPDSKYGSRCSDLQAADVRGSVLVYADLRGTNLAEVNLSGANLSEANLSYANLSYANLAEANLSGANLSIVNLSFANLSGANFWGANLSEANLYYADLVDADLVGANLHHADLSGANLSGANLWIPRLQGNELAKAKEIAKRNIQSAKNWKDAFYSPSICKLLEIPYKEPLRPV